ncbi:hypothetical protein BH20PSE1_BH20PSE1_01050 [soil metagenome]
MTLDENRPKHALMSRTILCSIAGMVASMAGIFGYSITCEEQAPFGQNIMAIITFVTSFGAFIFRLLATRRIG